MILHLPWDSDFFQYKTGCVTLDKPFDLNELHDAMGDFELVYVIVNNPALAEPLINHNEFLLVDQKITFTKKITWAESPDENILSFAADRKITNELIHIAIESGTYSRFRIDPGFSDQTFKKFYTTWITNSVNRKNAKEVLVYERDENIFGLVTLGIKNNKADIGLIAVDEQHRGRQIGKKLLKAADHWAFHQQGMSTIQVVTQKANASACAFYKKNGFDVDKEQTIFHWWKK